MSDLNEQIKTAKFKHLIEEAKQANKFVDPTLLKWSKIANQPLANQIAMDAGFLKAEPNTYVLPYKDFIPTRNAVEFPDKIPLGEMANLGGTSIQWMQNPNQEIRKSLNDSILLNLLHGGSLPEVYRHEYAHKTTPHLEGARNYGYMLPRYFQEFLNSYPPELRGEELKAELFGIQNVPKIWEDRNGIKREKSKEIINPILERILQKKIENEIGYIDKIY